MLSLVVRFVRFLLSVFFLFFFLFVLWLSVFFCSFFGWVFARASALQVAFVCRSFTFTLVGFVLRSLVTGGSKFFADGEVRAYFGVVTSIFDLAGPMFTKNLVPGASAATFSFLFKVTFSLQLESPQQSCVEV